SAVCVYHQGKKVVDLWGGHQDAARTIPWREDTMCLMYSIAKSICVLSVHILADRGMVDLDAPVADYWPEFAQNGKDNVLVRHILSHWCGVCCNDAADDGDIYDYDKMIRVLEVQEPVWPPETKGAYNTVNIGYLAGEVVRRVSGQPIRDFVRENICDPLGADYKIGVDQADLERVADLVPNPNAFSLAGRIVAGSPLQRALCAMPKPLDTTEQNTTRFRTAGVPSFGGFGTARGLTRIYAALANGGEIDGVRLLSPEAVARATTDQWEDQADGTTMNHIRMTMGFWKNGEGQNAFGPNPEAFGHSGMGGARVLADPDRNLALGYATNLPCEGLATGVRTEAIVDAAFANL
ncbi:MAG: beta-lactamase family protein, partial [Alphaproteobacteria bacterium]|nr:beta-lactamase family protein [Alphaproteobacteria bacterium]